VAGHSNRKTPQLADRDLKHELFDFQDAPILLISGGKALDLNADAQNKIKSFLDFGGTVLLHPNHDSIEFKKSAKEIFTKMYAKEGYEFSEVPVDHPVYLGPRARMPKAPPGWPRTRSPCKGCPTAGGISSLW